MGFKGIESPGRLNINFKEWKGWGKQDDTGAAQ
jgi:hypothetical protein